jgi:hypothetical protein
MKPVRPYIDHVVEANTSNPRTLHACRDRRWKQGVRLTQLKE